MSINQNQSFLEEFEYKQNISAYVNLTDREKEIHKSAFMSGYKLGQQHTLKSRQLTKVIYVNKEKSVQNKDIKVDIHRIANRQAKDIFDRVLKCYNRTHDEIISPRRLREYAEVRSVIINLLRELTPLSLPEIGRILGGRDHTTVLHHTRLKFDRKRFWSDESFTWKQYYKIKDNIEKESEYRTDTI